MAFTVVFKNPHYNFSSLEVASVGRTHFPAFERLGGPEVVFHSLPLVFLLSGEQQHPELAQLHQSKKDASVQLKCF